MGHFSRYCRRCSGSVASMNVFCVSISRLSFSLNDLTVRCRSNFKKIIGEIDRWTTPFDDEECVEYNNNNNNNNLVFVFNPRDLYYRGYFKKIIIILSVLGKASSARRRQGAHACTLIRQLWSTTRQRIRKTQKSREYLSLCGRK